MSSSVSTYVGPTIRTEATYSKKVQIQTCLEPTCKNHMKHLVDKFCSKCGSEVGVVETVVDTPVDLREIIYEELDGDEDFLFQPEYCDGVYIPQMTDLGRYVSDETGEGTFDLTKNNPTEIIQEFEKDPEMVKLIKFCEDNQISMKTGYEIVSFWS